MVSEAFSRERYVFANGLFADSLDALIDENEAVAAPSRSLMVR